MFVLLLLLFSVFLTLLVLILWVFFPVLLVDPLCAAVCSTCFCLCGVCCLCFLLLGAASVICPAFAVREKVTS